MSYISAQAFPEKGQRQNSEAVSINNSELRWIRKWNLPNKEILDKEDL